MLAIRSAATDYFVELAQHVGFVALDIGARGGVVGDLLPIAPAVEFYGFEPDPEECFALNSRPDKGPWKCVKFLPEALAESKRTVKLNLYKERGCTSAYRAFKEVGELFSRAEYYDCQGILEVNGSPLDQIVTDYGITSPAFMKIDVQGMEVDVFSGATTLLGNSLIGIRTEVSLFPVYEGQPLFAEVDQALRRYGFVPMRWLELHEWRRLTKAKYPRVSKGALPFSRGQMIHGDVLYLLHPEGVAENGELGIKRLVRLALVAVCYGHLDHAYTVFKRDDVQEYVKACMKRDPLGLLEQISKEFARSTRLARFWHRLALRSQ